MSYQSFDLLNKLYFVRTGGSAEELKAAEILKTECEAIGVEAHLESFKVDGCKIEKASVKFLNPDMEIECAGVGMSSSTSAEGITGEFVYVTNIIDAEIQNLEGKVCLLHSKLINQQLYKKLVDKKVQYTGQKKVSKGTTVYKHVKYSYMSYYKNLCARNYSIFFA